MEKRTDILIIEGSAAMTAKAKHPDKRVMMIRREQQAMIPYISGSLEPSMPKTKSPSS
ncbi:MAG: hypothetical protein ACLFSU_03965 [Acholeplasmataceae bacterium]